MEILKENLLGFTRFENEKFFIAECSTDFFFFFTSFTMFNICNRFIKKVQN